MSRFHVMLEKIEQACSKIDMLLEKKNKCEEFDDDIEDLMDDIPEDEEIMHFIKRFQKSKSEEEQQIMIDYNQSEPIKKRVIAKLMEMIFKISYGEQDNDLEKKKYWYEKLRDSL
jgi:hypothetical protein